MNIVSEQCSSVIADGFLPVSSNSYHTEYGKRENGALAIFINDRWCHPGHVVTKQWICSLDIGLLAMGLRPYYIRRGLRYWHYGMVMFSYPHSDSVVHVTHFVTVRPQTLWSMGTSTTGVLSGLQFVDCPIRERRTWDLLWHANVEEACSSIAQAQTHNVKWLPALARNVGRWTEEVSQSLQDCFKATNSVETLCRTSMVSQTAPQTT